MNFKPIRCPECNELAKGTIDTVPGVALFTVDPDTGDAEYDGETKMNWDGQECLTDENDMILLCCPNGHNWPVVLEGDQSQVAVKWKPTVACGTCKWEGTQPQLAADLANSENGLAMLSPGCEVPVGDCPVCGSWAYLKSKPEESAKLVTELRNALNTFVGVKLVPELLFALGQAQAVIGAWFDGHPISTQAIEEAHKSIKRALEKAVKP